MTKLAPIQTSFSSGALDPRLAARQDLEHYHNGLKTAVNILPLVLGGFSRRPGLKYISAAAGDGMLYPFEFNTSQTYLFAFTNQRVEIWFAGRQRRNLEPGAGAVWTAAQIPDLGITQSADTLIVCHEDHAPQRIVRGADHATWTISTVPLINVPLADFNDASSPSKTAEDQRLTFGGTWIETEWFKLGIGNFVTDRIFWTANETVLKSRILLQVRQGMQKQRTGESSFDEVGSPIPLATHPLVHAGSRQQIVQGFSIAGITVDGTYPTIDVHFDDGAADSYGPMTVIRSDTAAGTLSAAVTVAGVTRREVVWSATRGWPKHPVFFEGRLWFGASKQKPTSVWGSVANDFFNFDLGEGFDDDAIFVVLDTDQLNAVTGLAAGRRLHVLTSGGEHVVPESPVTPGSITMPQESSFGSKAIKPVVIDGSVIFVHRKGKQIREFRHSFVEDAFSSQSLTLLAPQLFDSPVDMAALKGTDKEDANYVYVVNSDGTVAVMLTERQQQLAAWAQWTTDGNFKSVAVVDDETYFLVQRGGVYSVEMLDATYFLDAASQITLGAPSVTFPGMTQLANKAVRVRGDGAVRPNATVSAGGAITLTRNATTIEAGLWFEPKGETMPPAGTVQTGSTMTDTKRIVSVDTLVHETLGLVIDGDPIADRQTDVDKLDTVPAVFTGVVCHHPSMSSFDDPLPTVTFSQNDPLPMTILGCVMRVDVNQRN